MSELPSRMRAARVRAHGDEGTIRIEEVSVPAPGHGEVLVEVRAAGVNHLDLWVRRGVPGHVFPLPMTLGSDAAGVIAAVGPGVRRATVGDAVIQRAVDRALATRPEQRYRRGFWAGAASGAALAAAVAALAIGVWVFGPGGGAPAAVPEIRVALNQRSDVTVAVESPEPLTNAEVRIELRGGVELFGYAGQRELKWSTDLDRGINQLTLPVVAIDASGGQVLVEVTHGQKRRAFVLDVRAAAPG